MVGERNWVSNILISLIRVPFTVTDVILQLTSEHQWKVTITRWSYLQYGTVHCMR